MGHETGWDETQERRKEKRREEEIPLELLEGPPKPPDAPSLFLRTIF
jgi:hypothetical protein